MARPAKKKWGPFHVAVVVVWVILAAWLIIPLLVGVISALFYGDGPVKEPAEPPAASAPAPEPPPRSAPGP